MKRGMLTCSLALLLSTMPNSLEALPCQKSGYKSLDEICYHHQKYNRYDHLNFEHLFLNEKESEIEEEKEIPFSPEVTSIKNIIDNGMSQWVFWNGKCVPKAIKIINVKTSFYYTAIEGDTPHHPSFIDAVKIEGSGFAYREGKLTYFYSYDGKTIYQEPYSEAKKRGMGADDSQGTLDIGFIAVPREIYGAYKNKTCWLHCNDGRYVKVKIKDIGSAIQKRGNYYDVDLYIGTGGSSIYTLGGLGPDMLYDKWDEMYVAKKERKKFVTRLLITNNQE